MVDRITACIQGKLGDDYDDDFARRVVDDFQSLARDEAISKGGSFEEAMKNANARMKYEKRVEALRKKHDQLINKERLATLSTSVADLKAQGLSDYRATAAKYGGVIGKYNGGKQSVDAQMKTNIGIYMDKVKGNLHRQGLLRIAQKPDMALPIARAWSKLTGGTDDLKGVPAEAKKIAEILFEVTEELRIKQNKSGAYIGELKGFAGMQTHNRMRIQKAGYEAWAKSVSPRLDWDNMNVPVSGREGYLKNAYKNLVEGKADGFGGANLARRVSESRDLRFKGVKEWLEYNEQFGSGNYFSGVVSNIQKSARDWTLLQSFGTNPHAMHKKLTGNLVLNGLDKFYLDSLFEQLTGDAYIPASPTLAGIGSTYRGLTTMRMLGGAIFSYVSDLAPKFVALNNAGLGFFDSLNTAFTDVFRGLNNERMEVAGSYGVFAESVTGSISGDILAADTIPGKMTKALDLYFTLNLQNWWSAKQKVGAANALANYFGRVAKSEFSSLHRGTQNTLSFYGITAEDWDVIRAAVVEHEGNLFIDGAKLSGDGGDKFRVLINEISTKTANPNPGAREAVYTTFGTKRGTPIGELVRCMMQFKSFPITFARRVLGPAILESDGFKGGATSVISIAAGTMAMAYIGDLMRQTAQGKTPPSVADPEYMKQLMIRSGFASLVGDMVLAPLFYSNNLDTAGDKILETAGGPLAADIKDVTDLAAATLDEGSHARKKLVSLAQGMVPGNNLFYIRPALNYIMFNQMKTWADPEYAMRMEGYAEKMGQTYYESTLNIAAPDRQLAKDVQ